MQEVNILNTAFVTVENLFRKNSEISLSFSLNNINALVTQFDAFDGL